MRNLKLNLKNIFKNKKVLLGLLGILVIILLVYFSHNDFGLYQSTIVEVINVETSKEKTESGPNREEENYYNQTLTAVVKNGDYQGKTLTLANEYSDSTIKTEQYQAGDCLFVDLTSNNGALQATITGVKRDTYLVLLLGITILGLLLAASKKGLLTVVSMAANAVIFIAWIELNGKSIYDPKNWLLLIVGFCIVTLFLVSGFHRKTLAAIVASLLSIGLIYGLYQLVAAYTTKLPFELVEYMTGPDSAEPVFIISVIVGSLGAIMDVAITISSSVSQLVNTADDIDLRELIASIREIAMDIMGTMINVLFFSYISAALFKIVMEIKNGYSLSSLLQFSFVFKVVRFLIGSIGIVVTIPLAGLIAILFFRKKMKKAGEV